MWRIGMGYDCHRFAAGRKLLLGGVPIGYELGLAGHSDADAVLHAVTDAILGALAAGDIGELFPATDPKWGGADSAVFVAEAVRLAAEQGCRVVNCDVTVLAEAPKLGPYKRKMAERIAGLLGIGADAVGVKAKSNEQMGFVGRGEGIAAFAIVLLGGAEGAPSQGR
jgi:2-C-methyl-D-erythritol 2,4-cyclodiphosphate synthase